MRKLVLRSFKGRKRELRISIIMLALIYMCGIMTILFQGSFYRSLESLRYEIYGEWTGAVFGAGESTEQILRELESTKQIGKIVVLGDAWHGGNPFGVMGAADETARSLGRIQMEEGRFPSDSTEIALTETALSRLAGQAEVGGKVEIAPAENGEAKSYTLSGIVKPWGREWETDKHKLPSVILGMDETVQGETYLLFQNDNPDEMNRIQARMEKLEEGTYVCNEKAYPLDISAVYEFFQDGKFVFYLVLVAAILIGYLMMLTLKSRRYSLTVLRGMGADAGEVIQLVLWESAFLWGMAFLAGAVLSALSAGAALYAVHALVKIPVRLEIQAEYILEYIACVTVIYFVCNLAVALTAIGSQIRTAFKLDSGLLECSAPPKLKRAEKLTFFTCLRRKKIFYSKIYAGRFVISVLVMVVSAICLRLFIEEKKEYEYLMSALEYAYDYQADVPAEGLTDGQIGEIEKIDGVKSVEKECFINSSTMTQDIMSQEIRISAPAFKDSEYVRTYRKYNQKFLGVPVEKEGDYFSVWELRGLGPQDEEWLSYYEKAADLGAFDREAFLAGEECVLLLPPYQIRDLGIGKAPVYLNIEEMDEGKKVYAYETDGNAIAPGDTVKISTPWGEREIRVGAVIVSPETDLSVNARVAEVSEGFLSLLCGVEETRYASVKINLDEAMDTAAAGAEVEGYFEMLGKETNLTDTAGFIRARAEESLFDGTQYLFVLTAVWIVYMLMMYHGNQVFLKNEGKRIGVFRALGMDRGMLKSRYLLENLSEGGGIILVSAAIVTGEFLIRLRTYGAYDSVRMFQRILADNPGDVRLFLMALLIAVTAFLGVSVVTLYIPLKKLSDGNIAGNLGDEERN